MLNAGGDDDAYQTVTIVPSDTNSGEVTQWPWPYLPENILNSWPQIDGRLGQEFYCLGWFFFATDAWNLKHISFLLQVSYVLIVQPEDEKKGKGAGGGEGEGDDDVYDFDGEPGTLAEFDPDAAEIKKPRPSQQVGWIKFPWSHTMTPPVFSAVLGGEIPKLTLDLTLACVSENKQTFLQWSRVNVLFLFQTTQTHMCRYCNYTTGKRYLLSRHMKSHSEERPHKCSVCERGFKTLASLQVTPQHQNWL